MKKIIMLMVVSIFFIGCTAKKDNNTLLKGEIERYGIPSGIEGSKTRYISKSNMVLCESLEQDQSFIHSSTRSRRMNNNIDYEHGRKEKKYCFVDGVSTKK